jgi:hypothetical protein
VRDGTTPPRFPNNDSNNGDNDIAQDDMQKDDGDRSDNARDARFPKGEKNRIVLRPPSAKSRSSGDKKQHNNQ